MPIIFKGVNEGDDPMDIVGSHQRCLIAALARVDGPVLELGVGWYSTPLLHEIARAAKRHLVTVDNNPHWLGQFKALECEQHKLRLVGWWGEFDVTPPGGYSRWGVCLVDQGQPIEREYAVRRLLNLCDVFVMHDTEEGFAYGYDRILPMFAYQWTDKCQRAWTTIASNTVDVTKWGMRELPQVEPSKDVT